MAILRPQKSIDFERQVSKKPGGRSTTDIPHCPFRICNGEVIQLKIPLRFLGNSKKLNLMVGFPQMHMDIWGDIEVDIVDWKARH